jgi:hypothetical protein
VGLILDTSALVALERAGAPLTEALAPMSEEEVAVPAEHFRRIEGITVETLKQ